jgi:geranylgeranylglycerol-phosphate geranylgeranyltransferase
LLHGLVSLARPVNCVVSFVAVTAACVIAGADTTDAPRIAIAAFAAVLLGAAGNVINDVFDVAIDRVNKPHRAIAAGTVSRRAATVWACLCAGAGLALSIPLGLIPLLIATGSVAAMYAYSAWLKRLPLVGNLAVSAIIGAAFIYGAAAFGDAGAGVVPALLAFGFNLAREVLKDVEDVRGDALHGARTYPVIAGERAALLLVSLLLVALLAGTAAPYVLSIYSREYFWVVLFGVDTVLIYVLFAMWNDRTQGNIARLNVLLKYDMFMGIIAIIAGTR